MCSRIGHSTNSHFLLPPFTVLAAHLKRLMTAEEYPSPIPIPRRAPKLQETKSLTRWYDDSDFNSPKQSGSERPVHVDGGEHERGEGRQGSEPARLRPLAAAALQGVKGAQAAAEAEAGLQGRARDQYHFSGMGTG